MLAILTIPGMTPSTAAKANYCRTLAKVITIAELANERGDAIPGNRMDGQWQAKSNLEWPNIPCPPKAYWAIFRRCIRQAFAKNRRPGRLCQPVRLDVPLGKWITATRHVQYKYYRTENSAYHRTESSIMQYNAVDRGVFHVHGASADIPEEAHPIDARRQHDTVIILQFLSLVLFQ